MSFLAVFNELTVSEDQTGSPLLLGNLLTNDTGATGPTSVTSITVEGITYSIPSSASVTVVTVMGTLSVSSNGNVTFQANNDTDPSHAQALQVPDSGLVQFSYTATDGATSATASVDLLVTGVNDAPTYTLNTASYSVSEVGFGQLGTASVAGSVTYFDVDDTFQQSYFFPGAQGWSTSNFGQTYVKNGTYGTLTYTLAGDSFVYQLDNTRPATQSLQTGNTPTETFSFFVQDGHGGQTQVNIAVTVNGSNDAPHAIALTSYTVNENALNGDIVGTLSATDFDDTSGFTYQIIDNAGGRFTLSGTNVVVADESLLNYEANQSHQITVQVTDSHGATFQQVLTISIGDVNEAPTITSNGGGATAAVTVAENTTAVTQVTASDVDAGTVLQYSIVGGADQLKFHINQNTGALTFLSAPSFESPTDFGANNTYEVTVRATDNGTGLLFDEQTITVSVTDVNEAPTGVSLTSTTTTLSEAASTATAIEVATIQIADPDAGGAGSNVVTLEGADAALFEVIGNKLYIKAGATLDYETNPVLDVTVKVTDATVLGSTPVTTSLSIALTDTNDVAPVFTSTATPSVAENSTTVVSLSASDVDTVGGPVTFSITGGADAALFQIAADGHTLEFKSAPNYETDPHSYAVEVTASDGVNSTPQSLTVSVTDTNDVAPVFTSTATPSVAENSTTVVSLSASDVDTVGGPVTFSITGGADAALFQIAADGHTLEFKSAPNYETDPHSYAVEVTASDGVNSTPQSLTVSVTDTNDVAPVFTSTATPSVAENSTTVVSLSASDVDTVGGPVTFSITGGADAALFQIAADGHTLEFKSAPNYETDPHSYAVEVTASDGVNSTPQSLTVSVTDTNDVAPVFTSTATPSVAENSTTVVSLSASDVDTVGGPVTFSITGGADAALFQIAADGHTLEFKSAPNYETDPHSYAVEVTASDGVNSTPQSLTVSVTDTNDVAPVFTSTATPSVAENSTTVVSLSASDVDTVGGPVTFSITGGADAALFQIAADGHTLEFKSAPNYETDPHSYAVEVTASDGVNSTPQSLTVSVTDTNDVAPVFTSTATPSVAENSTTVVSLSASDVDTVGGPVTFSITGGADAALFQIAADGHTLEFKSAPNYETDPHSYAVEVTASDGVNSTPQSLTVSVTDTNDVAPVFTSTATPSVAENSTTVVSLSASDVDTVGGPVTFSITGGADAALFQIAADGHTLEFKSAPNYETDPHSYAVEVTASDGVNSTPQSLTVSVTDTNDVAPVFTSTATPSVAENSTTVVSLSASDVDTVGGPVTFSITGGADAALFQIAADGHTLEYKSAPNYETDPHSYAVEVTASDGVNSTPQSLTVSVTDTNDVAPVFTSTATPSVAENSTTVVSLSASDVDTVGGPVTFSITGGADAALFQIAADGHTLEFKSAPNYETDPHSYAVEVTASDGVNSTPQSLTVSVTDTNDVAPVFTSTATPSVAENSTTVVSLSASDVDTVGGPVTFSITGGADAALFQIAADGHTLEFKSAPNYETDPHSYAVEVTASDGVNSTPQSLTVSVTDTNDVAPVFTSTATPSVAENSTTVVSLSASDVDTVGGPVTFSITGGADAALFQIAADGHTLEFKSAPNYETDPHSYAVEVTASDGVNSTPQSLTVSVTDQNEAPTGTNATITINEDTPRVLARADFGFSDPDSSSPFNDFAAVRIEASPSAGTIKLSGVPVTTFPAEFTVAQLDAGSVSFTPALNANGASYASISFSVKDAGGLYDTAPNTITVNVTAVNDSPVAPDESLNGSESTGAVANLLTGFLNSTDRPTTAGTLGFDAVNTAAVDPDVATNGDSLTVVGIRTGSDTSGNAANFLTITSGGSRSITNSLGTLTVSNNGSVDFVSNGSAPGVMFFSYLVSDSHGALSSNVLRITLGPVNDPPVLDLVTTTVAYAEQASPVTLAPLLSLTDVDSGSMDSATVTIIGGLHAGDTLSYGTLPSGVTATYSGGVLTFSGAAATSAYETLLRSVAFAAPTDEIATTDRTVTISVNDGVDTSNVVTLTVDVSPVNDAPVNTVGALTTNEDIPLPLTGISIADVDAQAGTISVTLTVNSGTLAASSGGNVTVSGSGTASVSLSGTLADINAYLAGSGTQPVFTPVANFSGNVSLTVTTNDGANTGASPLSDSDTVTITVNPVSDAPTLAVGTGSGDEDTPIAIGGIVATITDTTGTPETLTAITVASIPVGATLSDGIGPGAGHSFTATLATTSVDVNGWNLSALTITPPQNFDGTINLSVTATSQDGAATPATSAPSTLTVTVNPVSDAPTVLVTSPASGNEDTAIPLVINATTTDPDELLTAITISDIPVGAVLSDGAGGHMFIATLGQTSVDVLSWSIANLAITPPLNSNTSFSLSVTATSQDDLAPAATSTATTLAVNINPVNDAPVNSVPGAQTVAEDTALSISGLSVTDIDGNLASAQLTVLHGTVSVSLAGGASIGAGASGTSTVTLTGTEAQLNAALATVSYQGNSNYHGSDVLTLVSTDGAGTPLSDTDTVAITITAVNDPTTGITSWTDGNAGSQTEGDTLTASNTIADADGISGAISYQWQRSADGTSAWSDIGGATNTTYALTNDDVGRYVRVVASYTDDDGNTHTVLTDPASLASTATGQVVNLNDIPVANDDFDSGSSSGPSITGNVISGEVGNLGGIDTDADTANAPPQVLSVVGARLGFGSFTPVQSSSPTTFNTVFGSLAINSDGSYVFTPNALAQGLDAGEDFSFQLQYQLSDGVITTPVTAVLTLTLLGQNDAPVAGSDTLSTAEDTAVTFTASQLLGNDSDVDGNALHIGSVASGSGGTAVLNVDGSITFTPDANFAGAATFTYTVSDGTLSSTPTTVTVNVSAVNDAPTSLAIASQTIAEEGTVNFQVPAGTFTDIETSPLSYAASLSDGAALPSWLTFNGSTQTFTGTAPTDYNGTLAIKVTATDAGSLSTSQVFDLTVSPVNDAPVLSVAMADQTATEDSGFVFTVPSGTFTDVDNVSLTLSATGLPGWLSFNAATGTFSGTPTNADAGTSATITVTASDGALSTTDTFVVAVTAVNDGPVANADTATVGEDPASPLVVAVLANDTDVDNTALSVTSVTVIGGAAVGTATINANNEVVFTPAANFNGQAVINYTASDGALSDIGQLVVTVTPVNDAPVAGSDTLSTAEDTAVTFTASQLLGNDSDVDGNALHIGSVASGSGGTAVLNVDGSITFTPDANFAGAATFTYTVSDGTLSSTPTTVTVNVSAVNDAPTSLAIASQTIAEEGTVNFQVPAGTFTDIETSPLSYAASLSDGAALPSWLTFNGSTQTFTGTAPTDYNGTLAIKVTATDAGSLSTSQVFDLTVSPVNDAPVLSVAMADQTATEDSGFVFTVPSGTFTDVDNVSLTLSATGLPGWLSFNAATGTFSGTPTNADAGTSATITVTASDGALSTTDTFVVAVTAVNDGPVANADTATVGEDPASPLVVAVLANDTDVDNTALSVTSVTVIGGAAVGTATINANNEVVFTPAANFNGQAVINYTASDGALSDIGQLVVTVTPVNDAPVATPVTEFLREDTNTSTFGSLFTGVSDADVGASFDILGTVSGSASSLTPPSVPFTLGGNTYTAAVVGQYGSLAYNPDTGAYLYTVTNNLAAVQALVRNPTQTSVTDTFSFTVVDDHGSTTPQTVAFTIRGNDDGLALRSDFMSAIQDNDASLTNTATAPFSPNNVQGLQITPLSTQLNVLANDYDIDAGQAAAMVVTSFSIPGVLGPLTSPAGSFAAGATALLANGATISIATDGTVTFVQNDGYDDLANGEVVQQVVFYNVSQPTLGAQSSSGSSQLTLQITGVNDGPAAVDGVITTTEDTSYSGTLPVATDVDGDTLTYAVGSVAPSNGTVTVNSDGTFTYTPTADFNGADSFTYSVTDGSVTVEKTISVTVGAVNDAVTATAGTATAAEDGGAISIDVASLISDVETPDSGLTVTAAVLPAQGTVSVTGTVITFTPAANFNGPAAISYTVSDGATSASAIVALTVTAANDAPVASNGTVTTTEDVSYAGTLPSASDVDGNVLSYAAGGTAPAHGSVTVNANGTFTYTPATNYHGADSFTYTVSDGTVTVEKTISVTVASVNDTPATANGTVNTSEDLAVSSTLPVATDIDGDTLTYAAGSSGPAHGTVTVNPNGSFTYTPGLNYNGADSFTYTVSDGTVSVEKTMSVTVTAVNDAPVASNGSVTTTEDVSYAGTLPSASDVDGNVLSYAVGGTAPAHGSVTVNANGTFTYTPATNYHGADSFTYTVSDGTVTVEKTISVTVASVNDTPATANGTVNTSEDLAVSSTLPVATDIDGDTLTYAAGSSGPAHGTVTVNPNGSFTYTPGLNYNGADSFTYTVSDGTVSVEKTMSVTVTAVNDAPVASNGSVTTTEDVSYAGTLPSASDVDGNVLSYAVGGTAPAHGSVTVNANGTFTYTPTANYNGADSFTYMVNDGTVTVEKTITVTVGAVNDAPVASVISNQSVAEEGTVNFQVPTFSDVDGDTLTYSAASADGSALPGWLSFNGVTRTFTGTAPTDFNGTLVLRVTGSDGTLNASSFFSLTVTPVNDAAIIGGVSTGSVTEDAVINTVSGTLTITDVDSPASFVVATLSGTYGSLAMSANGTWTYTLDNLDTDTNSLVTGDTRTDTITVSATDGTQHQILITVHGANELGTAGNDTIQGSSLADAISGLAGDDIIEGRGAADTLDGGAGSDTLSYAQSAGGVFVALSSTSGAAATVSGGEAAGDVARNFENIYGTSAADTLVGNGSANTIEGGAGADSMSGGSGIDTLSYEHSSAGVNVTLRTGTLAAILSGGDATGDTAVGFENVIGSGSGDTLTGTTAANLLDGSGGADQLIGGAGNDSYVIDNLGDTIVEALSQGTDTVFSGITYTLGDNLENLTLTGSSTINATGNSVVNVITGNSGANIIDGGLGADQMKGGAGDDTYIVDNSADKAIEVAGGGTDTVQTSVSYVLGVEVEKLVLTGSASISGTGNALGNTITGNTGANTISGGAGNDVLVGGSGNDRLTGGTGADTFYFVTPTDGGDTIVDYSFLQGDRIQLAGSAFGGLAAGSLNSSLISFGSLASHSTVFFYDTAVDKLYYDADAGGAGAAVLLATFSTTTTEIKAADFLIV